MFAGVWIAIWLLVVLLIVLWVFLPFAVFDTKRLMAELVDLQKVNNDLLRNMQR